MSSRAEKSFITYYSHQRIVQDNELNELVQQLKEPLPSCFRINPNGPHAKRISQTLSTSMQFDATAFKHEDVAITPPRPLPWADGIWQLDYSRQYLTKAARKFPEVKALHKFLVNQTEAGNISRQEAVSMVPPLLLDVQHGHRVLDMCASPGSKTAQILEAREWSRNQNKIDSKPTKDGFVVANDVNKNRSYLLVHQTKRLGLDSTVVTCHKGQNFPGLNVQSKDHIEFQDSNVFDRVLCDVPCSGDGTMRKNPNIWRTWNVGQSLTLHPLQVQLALRAAALLDINGLMVYSTCSLNPVENEAVVSELLRRADGALELVDCSSCLPGLIRRKGMTSWSVGWEPKIKENSVDAKANIHWFETYDQVPRKLYSDRIQRSMFPYKSSSCTHFTPTLSKCMRFVPMDQNTGGFFVALIRKKNNLPGIKQCGLEALDAKGGIEDYRSIPPEGYLCKLCETPGHYLKDCSLSNAYQMQNENLAKEKNEITDLKSNQLPAYQQLSNEEWCRIQEYYGINDKFPKDRLYSCSDGVKSITLVHPEVQKACLLNNVIQIVNTGVHLFTRISKSRAEIDYRPTQEGLNVLLPFITKRLIHLTFNDYKLLLKTSNRKGILKSAFSNEIEQQLDKLSKGPVILQLNLTEFSNQFAMTVWNGGAGIIPLASTIDIDAMYSTMKMNGFLIE